MRASPPISRNAAGSAALTSPSPPVFTSGTHSGVAKSTLGGRDWLRDGGNFDFGGRRRSDQDSAGSGGNAQRPLGSEAGQALFHERRRQLPEPVDFVPRR